MEEGPKNEKYPEDLTIEDGIKYGKMLVHAEKIKEYIFNKEISVEWAFELNNLLSQHYEEFIPELNSEKLRPYCYDFTETIKAAEQKLAEVISGALKYSLDHNLTPDQIKSLKHIIKIIKEEIIQRLKKQGLYLSIKILEGAVMQAEIKVASEEE